MNTLFCLALAAHMEARQHYKDPDALAAVVAVVQNRADDPRYPNNACKVIAEPGQFPWYTDGIKPVFDGYFDEQAWEAATAVAQAQLDGEGLGITSTHFHTLGQPQSWVSAFDMDGLYGGNVFYTNNTRYK